MDPAAIERNPQALPSMSPDRPDPVLASDPLGFVYRFAAVDGFGKPGKSAAAAAITLTTQGEMCI